MLKMTFPKAICVTNKIPIKSAIDPKFFFSYHLNSILKNGGKLCNENLEMD